MIMVSTFFFHIKVFILYENGTHSQRSTIELISILIKKTKVKTSLKGWHGIELCTIKLLLPVDHFAST